LPKRIASGRRSVFVPNELSRLGIFMVENDVTIVHSGLNARYIGARATAIESTLKAMRWIAGGMSEILGSRVHLGALFNLDPDDP
jgi:hypothetical protein